MKITDEICDKIVQSPYSTVHTSELLGVSPRTVRKYRSGRTLTAMNTFEVDMLIKLDLHELTDKELSRKYAVSRNTVKRARAEVNRYRSLYKTSCLVCGSVVGQPCDRRKGYTISPPYRVHRERIYSDSNSEIADSLQNVLSSYRRNTTVFLGYGGRN